MPEDQHTGYIRLSESLIQDYRSLASETKRKFPHIKDGAEKQVLWLRSRMNTNEDLKQIFLCNNPGLIIPFISGCATKQQKIVVLSLTALQRLVSQECLSEEGAGTIIDTLWSLMDMNMEELRVLQTTILLLTTSALVRGKMLSKAFSLCLRLHDSKTLATINTAAAALRQCASAMFDRVLKEEFGSTNMDVVNNKFPIVQSEDVQPVDRNALRPVAQDAYYLFQDICALLNDDPAMWLYQITGINRSLGLELIEYIISLYSTLFQRHVAFAHLLKTTLCPLVIKLFSPSLKLRSSTLSEAAVVAISAVVQAGSTVLGSNTSSSSSQSTTTSTTTATPSALASSTEKAQFATVTRLKRVISVIVGQYFYLLNTECEIYLALLIRFLDVDKVAWQRALALEVLHKFASQPDLLRHICISYDMRPHSTKIFNELVNAISHYVQYVLANPSANDELTKESNQSLVATSSPGQNQSLLYYKGSFFPIIQPKSFLVDMLDRSEAPNLPDGYCLSIAFGCLLRIVHSLEVAIKSASSQLPESTMRLNAFAPEHVNEQLIALSWCGLLSTFALLVESSADDQITASLLQALHMMIGLCGTVRMETARDSFVLTLCKCALPGSFARSNSLSANVLSKASTNQPLLGIPTSPTSGSVHEDTFERSPVVIVVTQGAGHHINVMSARTAASGNVSAGSQTTTHTLSTASSTVNAESHLAASKFGSLLLTAKHLQSARAVLHAAQTHGNVLGTAWDTVLRTLQNLVWMLGLRVEPSAPLFFKSPTDLVTASSSSSDLVTSSSSLPHSGANSRAASSAFTSSVSSDVNHLSSMMSALFLQSSKLNTAALDDLVLNLCQLSSEAMEEASVNKEPSQFPVAKLTEVGLVNTDRLDLWWDHVSSQLLSMCKLSHTDLRQLAVNALVLLIKQAIAAPQSPTFWENESLHQTVLDPLSALSDVTYDDVREKQLECVQHMLHCWGEHIGTCWLRLIEMIGVVHDSFKVDLILTAFQCFKLIVTDYLPSLLPNCCYAACIETAARFGRQQQDLNIALSAIGTILHLADHVFQMNQLPVPKPGEVAVQLHDLWISIFRQLSQLCLDRRSTIRKSACQTLFNTVECHSARRFDEATWSALFWQVLFPLLTDVRELYRDAPVERDGRPNSLLIHHSRDTAAKQWAETVVLSLSGVTHVFVSKQDALLLLDQVPQFWSALLQHIKVLALTDSSEISLIALTSLHGLLDVRPVKPEHIRVFWSSAWDTWLEIATNAVELRGLSRTTAAQCTSEPSGLNSSSGADESNAADTSSVLFLPTTAFMTLLFDVFLSLFPRIRSHFTATDFAKLDKVFRLGALIPLHVVHMCPQASHTVLPVTDKGTLSQLQLSLLRCIECLLQNLQPADSPLRSLLPLLLHLLLALANYAIYAPRPEQSGQGQLEHVPLSYIVFAERCLQLAVDTYLQATYWDDNCKSDILELIIKTLHRPMALKYACPSQSTWVLASRCFFQVIDTTVPLLASKKSTKEPDEVSRRLCTEIVQTLQDFLFYQQQPPSSLSIEEFQQHEELDCKFVILISDLYLASSVALPDVFVSRLVHLLSLGSVQAAIANDEANGETSGDHAGPDDACNLNGTTADVSPTERLRSSLGLVFGLPRPTRKPSKGGGLCGMAVRQSDPLLPPPPLNRDTVDALADSALNLDLDLDKLRQRAFREQFARLCFSRLLHHAFAITSTLADTPPTGGASIAVKSGTTIAPSGVSVTVSRAAVRSILQRCRTTLIQFYQSSQLTGKCPLPRARLVEIAYVFKALTIMLTSLQSVSSHRDVDPSTWRHVIDLYPHIVDCILVTGGSPMTVALHRLLRLYGDLLRPASIPSSSPSGRL